MKESDRHEVREMIREALDEIESRHASRIEDVVSKTINSTLEKFGVDTTDFKGEQADRTWTRNNRLASQKLHSVGYATAIAIAITSFAAVLWTGFVQAIFTGK